MDALVAAIVATPDDDAPRLVWADREGGERGELVIVQCALAERSGPLPRAERRKLARRERELLAKLARPGELYVRGFLERARVTLDALGPALFDQHPLLRGLILDDVSSPQAAWTPRLALLERALAALPRLETLAVRPHMRDRLPRSSADVTIAQGPALLTVLRTTGHLENLRELTVDQAGFRHPAQLESLAECPQLETLRLGDCELSWSEAAEVVNSLPNLRHFGLHTADFDTAAEDVEPFFAHVEPGRLRAFELSTSWLRLTPSELARYPATLSALEMLHISLFEEDHLQNLTEAPALANLRALEIVGSSASDTLIQNIACAPFARNLRRLVLSTGAPHWFTAKSASVLASLPSLTRLEISHPVPVLAPLEEFLDVRIGVPHHERRAR